MVKSLLHTFDDNLFVMPKGVNKNVVRVLKQMSPFQNLNIYGVIPNCYSRQLYAELSAIYDAFGISLQATDALCVVIKPNQKKQKVLSCFK